MKIFKQLRMIRKNRNITLVSLSTMTGISYSKLQRIEGGTITQPHPTDLRKICRALAVDYEQLLHQIGYLSKSSDLPVAETLPLLTTALFETYADKNLDQMLQAERAIEQIPPSPTQAADVAVKFSSNDHYPYFKKNDIVLVDRRATFHHQDMIIIRNLSKVSVQVCRWLTSEQDNILESLHQQATPCIQIVRPVIRNAIVGKIVEKRFA